MVSALQNGVGLPQGMGLPEVRAVTIEINGRLADDLARCHDAACKDSPICARYVQRHTGRVQDRSLRKGAIECAALILDRSTP